MSTDKYGELLLPYGGYRRLKSFQLARLIYDITVHFVELYIPADSRTRDQMVQAARSGVQNIAEGSVDAATSTKLELNLYNVARASLEELRLDYEDFLRQHGESFWQKTLRCIQNSLPAGSRTRRGFALSYVGRKPPYPPYPSVQIRTGRQRCAVADRHDGLFSQTPDRKQGKEFFGQRRLFRTHGPNA